MKLLFTRLLLLAGLTATFASCSKDKDNNDMPAGITCTIDGTNLSFSTNAFALKNDGSGNYTISVFGSSDATANASVFGIVLGGEAPITTGTYTFNEDQDDQASAGMITYVPSNSVDGFMSVPGPSTTPTEIVVTSISDKSIQGTFKGDIIALTGTTPVFKTVTNGKFNVTFME